MNHDTHDKVTWEKQRKNRGEIDEMRAMVSETKHHTGPDNRPRQDVDF